MYRTLLKIISVFLMCFGAFLQVNAQEASFDVLDYDAVITPNFADKSVRGEVSVEFVSLVNGLKEIELNAGALEINWVREKLSTLKFEKKRQLLKIKLGHPLKLNEKRVIKIAYHGIPKYGIRFFPEQNQVYTIFSTSQWMPCVDSPDDRATFRLQLNFSRGDLTVVANGLLKEGDLSPKNKPNGFVWEQKIPIPTYLFGFAAGEFREIRGKHENTVFRYLVPKQFSETEVNKIFRDSADMLEFFESKAGMNYPEKVYTQVLAIGNAQQEMGGFTVMNEKYGRGVLENEKAIWLGVHEFAHQWWGNMVTNRDWTHFWLNEGITNFMTAAYLEHRFGQEEYKSEIKRYKLSYEKVRDAGKDKSLAFPDWNKPTREDRKLVYDKGAYVMHLLREEMGDKLFWKGIKAYTRMYWGKSVTTKDFQNSIENSSKKNLSEFFDKWIYLKASKSVVKKSS